MFWAALPHTMLEPQTILLPQTMLEPSTPSAPEPHTMFVPVVPQTTLSSSDGPQTRLLQSPSQELPQTMLLPQTMFEPQTMLEPHTMLLAHAVASGRGTPPLTR